MNIALPLMLVRRMSQVEFGLYKQAFLLIATSITILPLGFHMSAYYFFPREPERRASVVLNILLFHLATTGIGCLFLWLFPGYLLQWLFNSQDLAPYVGRLGVLIVSWGVSAVLETIVVANQEAKLSAIFIFLAQFSKTVMLVGAAALFGTVSSLIWAAMLQGIGQTVGTVLYLHLRFPVFWEAFDWGMLRRQVSYAWRFATGGLLNTVETDFHNYFVSNYYGATIFASYSIGCTQIPLVNILSDSILGAMLPRVSGLQKEGRKREILELIARGSRKLSLAFFPLFVFLTVAGRLFIVTLFTKQYEDSWPVFAVNLLLIPVLVLVADPVVRASIPLMQTMLKMHLVLAAVIVGVLSLFGRQLGLVGVIGVVVATNVVARVFVMGQVLLELEAKWGDAVLWKPLLRVATAAVVAGLPVLVVGSMFSWMKGLPLLVLSATVYGVGYALMLLLLRVIQEDEWALLGKVLSRIKVRQV